MKGLGTHLSGLPF